MRNILLILINLFLVISLVDDEKIYLIFDLFDAHPKDDYLSYRELIVYQQLTNPSLPLTVELWKHICRILDTSIYIGLDITKFNDSYHLYSDIMGTDLNKDYKLVKEYMDKNNLLFVKYTTDYKPETCSYIE